MKKQEIYSYLIKPIVGVIILWLLWVHISSTNSKNISEINNQLVECQSNSDTMNDSIKSLHENIKLLNQVNKDLLNENQIFTSMLSEIENTSGGHEILKELWENLGYDEE